MLNNGLYDLDPRKLAALVTFLVHDLAGVCEAPGLPEGYRLERLGAPDFARYCTVDRAVGEDWLWFSRLRMPEEELWQILHASKVHALELLGPEGAVGLLELDFRDEKTPELAFFGLVPGAVGLGLGKALMGEALSRAKTAGAEELYVHTCSLDHPRALDFYCRSGFRPFRRAVEVFDDPRLDGTLPADAARWMPVITP